MKFLKLLFSQKSIDIKFLTIMAVASGLANAFILAIINQSAEMASNEDVSFYYLGVFIVVFAIFYIAKKRALIYSANHIENAVRDIKIRISDKIRHAELSTMDKFEQKNSQIYNTLVQDTSLLAYVGSIMIDSAASSIMLLFALGYMFFISPIAFAITFIIISFGSYYYLSLNTHVLKKSHEATKVEHNLLDSLIGMLSGFNEIKINRLKSDRVFASHSDIAQDLRDKKTEISLDYVSITMFFQVLLYLLLALVLFVLPHLDMVDSAVIIKIIASLLFIMSPLEKIIDSIPIISKADVAIVNIQKLEKQLDSNEIIVKNYELDPIKKFDTIELNSIEFNYYDKQGEKSFGVGAIDLKINSGDIIFIVGGNGSGKSTLIKLLLGLYFPHKGSISCDNKEIVDQNYAQYRDLFSIVLTDFHLFDKLYGVQEDNSSKVNKLLEKMGLSSKTAFVDGAFTNLDLSTGQRKRVALINSILEDKQIYVFDEWASDQDPEFREYFYNTLLKELKAQGKTIIAVTHDDKYFGIADKIYKLTYGKLSKFENI